MGPPSSSASSAAAAAHEPLAITAFRVTELAPPNLPTSFFDRGSGLEASSERLSSLVVEGLVIDTSERGATAESLWAGGNATRVRLRPLHVALRVDERVQNLSEREKRTTRSAMKDVELSAPAEDLRHVPALRRHSCGACRRHSPPGGECRRHAAQAQIQRAGTWRHASALDSVDHGKINNL